MVDFIQWLEANALGFDVLGDDERYAILDFSLVWSFFEAQALNRRASVPRMMKSVAHWDQRGTLDEAEYSEQLNYFKARYFDGGSPTRLFEGLRLRSKDHRRLVEIGLSDDNPSPGDKVIALLIITYRLRNNLFHGEKWAYGIRDQSNNFRHASSVLISALETHSRSAAMGT